MTALYLEMNIGQYKICNQQNMNLDNISSAARDCF